MSWSEKIIEIQITNFMKMSYYKFVTFYLRFTQKKNMFIKIEIKL